MNQKKPLSDTPWVQNQMQEMRSDEPSPEAIDRAVHSVLAYKPTPRYVFVWKAASFATVAGIAGLFVYVTTQPASAAGLHAVADAFRHQSKRHCVTYRPNAGGEMVQTNEDWIDGRKNAMVYRAEDGVTTTSGYNGARIFVVSSKDGGGFVDDMEPSAPPVEDIDAYLKIPGARVLKQTKSGKYDVYSIGFSDCRFDIFVDPATRLPVQRMVMTIRGKVIERNDYDYPSQFSANVFEPPATSDLTDYPALRQEIAQRVAGPGQTKTIGGVTITLKAVLVGKSRILALWTGGAKADAGSTAGMWIEGIKKPIAEGRPSPTVIAGKELLGDGAWYQGLNVVGPFVINVPVWGPDGTHSKVVGRLTFTVNNPIHAQDPDRVFARPTGGVGVTGSTKTQSSNP